MRVDRACVLVFPDALTEDKHDIQMELEAQQTAGSSTSFSSSSPGTALQSHDPILPLLPTADGMMLSASPDKHLQTLLTPCALQQLEAERESATPQNTNKAINCSSSETASLSSPPLGTIASTQLNSPQPASSMNSDSSIPIGIRNCDNSVNDSVSSGYVSDMSAVDRLSNGSSFSNGPGELTLTTKDSSMMNIYKFKHNITKRFSLEGKIISQQYDGSSSTSSRETDEEHHHHGSFKYRSYKNKCRHASSSDSGPYPMSEFSGATSTSSHDSIEGSLDRSRSRKVASKSFDSAEHGADSSCSSMPLPGFVLHPSGTHYMPMSVCRNISEVFDTGLEAGHRPAVFHPISIPVHFRGPVISVPGSSLCSQYSSGAVPIATVKNTGTASQLKDTQWTKKGQGM